MTGPYTTARYDFSLCDDWRVRCSRACASAGLGDHHRAGRVLVESSDERGSLIRRPVSRVPEQHVQKRARRVQEGGVRHDAGRFVGDEEMFVLVKRGRAVHPRGAQAHAAVRRAGRTVSVSPSAARVETRRTTRPLIETRPSSIHVCTRLRVARSRSVRWRRITRSILRPASPRSAVRVRGGKGTVHRKSQVAGHSRSHESTHQLTNSLTLQFLLGRRVAHRPRG